MRAVWDRLQLELGFEIFWLIFVPPLIFKEKLAVQAKRRNNRIKFPVFIVGHYNLAWRVMRVMCVMGFSPPIFSIL